jgi:hypothetical protein
MSRHDAHGVDVEVVVEVGGDDGAGAVTGAVVTVGVGRGTDNET